MNARRSGAIILAFCLASIATAGAVGAQAAGDIERRPVEDPLFGVSSVVPADWQDLGGGIYSRGTPPADPALIAIQSAPATPDQLWPSLLPQFGLTEIPPVTDQHSSELFEWTLYQFAVKPGGTELSIELALAEDDGSTHVVLLQSSPEEFDVLREQVLPPAIDAFAPLAPEPTPDPSTLGYQVEEVSFPGGSAGVELAGTLTLPSGPGPHPVVVLMSGSGAQDRDESLRPISTIKPFALIADALTSAGVGVLRYDDRGVGDSSGEYESATVQELASDGRAAIDYLTTRDDVDQEHIGVLGHSEGGLYAAMLAPVDPHISFVVAMAPPAVDGVSLLIAQNEALLRAAGESEEEIAALVAYVKEALPLARDGDEAGVRAAAEDYFGALWDRQSQERQALMGAREGFVQRQVDATLPTFMSDWYRSLLAHDPRPDWEQVTVPVLGLFGAKDVQVVTEQNEPALRAALETAGNEDFETVVFPGANHLFQEAVTGAFGEYSQLEPEFTADFLPTLVEWITSRAGVAG